jgi:zinc protease
MMSANMNSLESRSGFWRQLGSLGLLVAALNAALACASAGLPDQPVLKEYNPEQWVGTPKSGLRIIVQEDHSSPLVTVVSTFGVGAKNDPRGMEGLAHFVEHLVFRSRPGGGEERVWDLLKQVAVSFNATTSWDFTNYFITTHKDNFPLVMQLEAWRLARTIDGVSPQVFATEKEVVRNELRQRWETSQGNRLFDMVFETLFPAEHPLRRPIGGTHESLTAATLEHAKKFVEDHYRPDNCTIVIVGDITAEKVKEHLGMWPAEVLFGPAGPEGPAVPPRPRVGERPAPPVPPLQIAQLKQHKGPIEQPTLVLAWSLPPGLRGQDTVAEFAAGRLNLAISEGLVMREEDDILGVGAGLQVFADASVMTMFANLRPGADPEMARKRLLDVLVNAWATDLGRLQTETTRWSTATSFLRRSASPLASATQIGSYMAGTGKTAYFKDNLEQLAAIQASQVMQFAYRWLTRERAGSVFFEPESDQAPAVMAARGGSGSAASPKGPAVSHDLSRGLTRNAAELTSERLKKILQAPGIASIPRFKISSGLEIFTISQRSTPLAQIRLELRGGDASTKPVGAASLAAGLARPGCRRHRDLSEVGGSIGAGFGLTSSNVGVSVLSGNLANGLAALRDRVSCMSVSEETFMHVPRSLEQSGKVFERMSTRPEFIASKRFFGELYPQHPFGEATFVNPVTLKDVRYQDAQAFVASHFRPDNGVAVVYGDVSPDEVKALSERYLADWQGGGGLSMSTPPAPAGPSQRRFHLVNRGKATQATVLLGCRLANVRPDRVPAYDVLRTLASESAWALREQWGATYGIGANVTQRSDNSADLVLSGAVENAQVGRSLTRLLGILQELGTGSTSELFFLSNRWDVGRAFMSNFATAGAKAGAIFTALAHGWPLDVWDRYPENLASTSRDTIKEIMAPCLGKEVVAIVGDASVLRPQLEKEGLALEGN